MKMTLSIRCLLFNTNKIIFYKVSSFRNISNMFYIEIKKKNVIYSQKY